MKRVVRLGFMLALAGCHPASGTRSLPDASALRGVELFEVEIEPKGPSATRYGERVQPRQTSVEQLTVATITRAGLTHDPALSKMAGELAVYAPDRANIPPALVDALMTRAGLFDPPPRLIIVEVPGERVQCTKPIGETCRRAVASLLGQVKTSDSTAREVFGVGASELPGGGTRLVVAVLERAVMLQPIPIELRIGQTVKISGRLLGSRGSPSVEVVDPRGQWSRKPTAATSNGGFEAIVDCRAPAGAYQVEVLAEGPYGPEVAANFPLFCGTEMPDEIRVEMERLAPDVTPEQLAHANFFYLNDARRRRGLPELVWDPKVAAVAERHSADMMRSGFVGHRSPTTGDVRERFERAGLGGSIIRENVARGYGPKGIHESLMRSPGHRANMLARDVTHVGIGFVMGRAESSVASAPRPLFATQNFVRQRGAGAPENARLLAPTLRQHVDAMREDEGRSRVRWNASLDRLAQRLAAAQAKGDDNAALLEDTLAQSGHDSLEMRQAQSSDFFALAGLPVWQEASLQAGVGVARRGEGEQTRFYLVVLIAKE